MVPFEKGYARGQIADYPPQNGNTENLKAGGGIIVKLVQGWSLPPVQKLFSDVASCELLLKREGYVFEMAHKGEQFKAIGAKVHHDKKTAFVLYDAKINGVMPRDVMILNVDGEMNDHWAPSRIALSGTLRERVSGNSVKGFSVLVHEPALDILRNMMREFAGSFQDTKPRKYVFSPLNKKEMHPWIETIIGPVLKREQPKVTDGRLITHSPVVH